MLGSVKILFIVNPLSHEIKGRDISSLLNAEIDLTRFTYDVVFTEASGHAAKLARDAIGSYDIIAAVGGDGTVNEVASSLIHSDTALAIIPVGSGNGLARHLKIPVGLRPALKALKHSEAITIDTGKINAKPFVVAAGIGFDALVADRFASFGKRGLLSYLQVALKAYFSYEPKDYRLQIDGEWINRKAFLISFANGSQYGNDFQIAPAADLQDGKLDVVIVKPVSLWQMPGMLFRSRFGTFQAETVRCEEVKVATTHILTHVDGEPITFDGELHICVVPRSLRIMVPSSP
jgi:diacylglycerol kinase (ATP)